jgi:hypothetical protein
LLEPATQLLEQATRLLLVAGDDQLTSRAPARSLAGYASRS